MSGSAASEPAKAPLGQPSLLAVDLGLRTGLAYFDAQGDLLRYASRHFGGRDALRRGAASLIAETPTLGWLVVEGDARLARAWIRPARARGLRCIEVDPATWRRALLLPRQQAPGRDLKREARRVAADVIARSGANASTALRHDAAEAILIGLWACGDLGWRGAASAS